MLMLTVTFDTSVWSMVRVKVTRYQIFETEMMSHWVALYTVDREFLALTICKNLLELFVL